MTTAARTLRAPAHERAPAAAAPTLSAESLSALLGLIYEAALEPDTWSRALSAIRVLFDANYVSLIVRPGTGDDLGLIVPPPATSRPST